jgi:hypothetical protein
MAEAVSSQLLTGKVQVVHTGLLVDGVAPRQLFHQVQLFSPSSFLDTDAPYLSSGTVTTHPLMEAQAR